MGKYKLTANQEYLIRQNDGLISKENNFGVLVNGEYAYNSARAEQEGWTWVTKETEKGRCLKSGEKPVAWHTTQYGKPFFLYKKEQFEDIGK